MVEVPDRVAGERAADPGNESSVESGHDTPEPDAAVQVPELVGIPAAEAHDRALDAGVLAVAENAWHTGGGRAHVGRQDPAPGTELRAGAIVRIWISTG
ncbi:PASTA domain-containing protein [Actinomycetospora sp.]|uniref:PASTA domain-containing protein n=1 Tax=Actinomycetospora sp. TaxID=1872135 RepID=UPI002F3F5211